MATPRARLGRPSSFARDGPERKSRIWRVKPRRRDAGSALKCEICRHSYSTGPGGSPQAALGMNVPLTIIESYEANQTNRFTDRGFPKTWALIRYGAVAAVPGSRPLLI